MDSLAGRRVVEERRAPEGGFPRLAAPVVGAGECSVHFSEQGAGSAAMLVLLMR